MFAQSRLFQKARNILYIFFLYEIVIFVYFKGVTINNILKIYMQSEVKKGFNSGFFSLV
jgi:hypothetical protein